MAKEAVIEETPLPNEIAEWLEWHRCPQHPTIATARMLRMREQNCFPTIAAAERGEECDKLILSEGAM